MYLTWSCKEYHYSPLDRMLVHQKVTPPSPPTNLSGFPGIFFSTHFYSWVEMGTVRIKCFAQEHNISTTGQVSNPDLWTQSPTHWLLGRPISYMNCDQFINAKHPNISMYILHTVSYTFTKVLARRFFLTIKSSCTCWSFPLFSWP